jgi:Tol biopolymer transport system component
MRVLWIVWLAACSFHSPQIGDQAIDASDAPGDVPVDTPPSCEARWAAHTIHFTTPVPIAELNTSGYERDPYLSPDELTIMYSTDRTGGMGGDDIWTAKRTALGAPFQTPTLMPDVNSTGDETKLSMTSNGLLVVIGSNRTGGQGGTDLWQGVRSSASGAFTMSEMHMGAIDTNVDQHDPVISADGLRLYFAPVLSGAQKIAIATRTSTDDDFSSPTPLATLDSGTGEADPALAFDDKLIVFASHRAGTSHLYYATRAQPSDSFGPPDELTDLATTADDGDPWVSNDGCRIYYASYASGNPDLYVATATP